MVSARGELAVIKRQHAKEFSVKTAELGKALRALMKLNQLVYKITNTKTYIKNDDKTTSTYNRRVVTVNVNGKVYHIGKNEIKSMNTVVLNQLNELKKLYAVGTAKPKSNRVGSDNFSDPTVFDAKIVNFFLNSNLGTVNGDNTSQQVSDYLRNTIFGQNRIGSIGIINSLLRLYAHYNNLYGLAAVNAGKSSMDYSMNKIGVDNSIRNTFRAELNAAGNGFNPNNTDIISLSRVLVNGNFQKGSDAGLYVKDDAYKAALKRFLRNIKDTNMRIKDGFKARADGMKGLKFAAERGVLRAEYEAEKRSLDYSRLAGNDANTLRVLVEVKTLSQNLSTVLHNVDVNDVTKAERMAAKKTKKAAK